jgi:hypothetical protein
VEGGIETGIDRLQVGQRKLLQIASTPHGQLHGLPDGFVREA